MSNSAKRALMETDSLVAGSDLMTSPHVEKIGTPKGLVFMTERRESTVTEEFLTIPTELSEE
jgi:hypothetical protein